jgi:hypothetical protein
VMRAGSTGRATAARTGTPGPWPSFPASPRRRWLSSRASSSGAGSCRTSWTWETGPSASPASAGPPGWSEGPVDGSRKPSSSPGEVTTYGPPKRSVRAVRSGRTVSTTPWRTASSRGSGAVRADVSGELFELGPYRAHDDALRAVDNFEALAHCRPGQITSCTTLRGIYLGVKRSRVQIPPARRKNRSAARLSKSGPLTHRAGHRPAHRFRVVHTRLLCHPVRLGSLVCRSDGGPTGLPDPGQEPVSTTST